MTVQEDLIAYVERLERRMKYRRLEDNVPLTRAEFEHLAQLVRAGAEHVDSGNEQR